MSTFQFTELVSSPMPDIVSTVLGVSTSAKFSQEDIGKPVKLGALQNYALCATGDDIEGFVVAVEPNTVNDGFSFGSVRRNKRMTCRVSSDQTATLAVGEYAVAGIPSALGTKDDYPMVKEGAGVVYKWRVLRVISGTGVAGDLVLIERV